jgi:MFS family permease
MQHTTRNLNLYIAGCSISSIGNWILATILPLWVLKLTDSPLALGGVVACQIAPTLLIGPIAGVYADRWNRKRTIVMGTMLQGLLTLTLLGVSSSDQLPMIYLISFLVAACGTLILPAQEAILPSIVAEHQVLKANSLIAIGGTAARFLGPAIAGLLLSIAPFSIAIIVDASTYIVMSVAIGFVTVSHVPSSLNKSIVASLRESILFLRSSTILLGVLLTWSMLMLASGAMEAILAVFVKETGGTDAMFAFILSLQGVGLLIGGIATLAVSERLPANRIYQIGLIALGLTVTLLSFSSFPYMYVSIVLVGVSMAITGVAEMTLFQELTPEPLRGRVLALDNYLVSIWLIIGVGGSALLSEYYGARNVLILGGGICLLAAVLGITFLTKKYEPVYQPEKERAETVL